MHNYRIAGLAVMSEIALPGAIPVPPVSDADILIRRRPVPQGLEGAYIRGVTWEVAGEDFLLRLDGIGRLLACGGRTLDVESAAGADPEDIVPFLLSTGLGVLLHQRGGLVLHAAAVARDGRAYAFCGRGGIGKSTLAAALCRSGCGFVGDDIALVDAGSRGHPVVWPDGRQMKLFDTTIQHLGLAARRKDAVRTGVPKYFVEPPTLPEDGDSVAAEGTPLAALYILRDLEPPHSEGIERLPPLDAAQLLLNHSYRRRLVLALARSGANGQVTSTAEILRHVPVFRLTRPRDLARLNGVVARLMDHWQHLDGPC